MMHRFNRRRSQVNPFPRFRREHLIAAGAYVREVYTAPFRADDDAIRAHSLEAQEARRRAAILRMILFTTSVAVGCFAVPTALLLRLPADSVWVLALTALLALFALLRCQKGQVMLAALLFIGGGMVLGLGFGLVHPPGIDAAVLGGYSSITILILIAAILLPAWLAWPINILAIALTVVAVAVTPVAPGLVGASGADATKTAILGQLVTAEVVTALLGSIAARSARAGLEAAAEAFARERELAQVKDRFLIELNHELRTPITAWYWNTDLLTHMADRVAPEKRAQLLARAQESGDAVMKLLKQINAAEALSITAPLVNASVISLADRVERVLQDFAKSGNEWHAAREVTVDISPKLCAWADGELVDKVIRNLLTNAVNYSPKGAPITITGQEKFAERRGIFTRMAHDTIPQPDFVQLNVRDQGLGIPRTDIPKLFQRFVRLERDIAGTVRGMGIGLYQSRLLVEAMGGQIWVESLGIEGHGSTFSFTLPAAPSTCKQAEKTSDDSAI